MRTDLDVITQGLHTELKPVAKAGYGWRAPVPESLYIELSSVDQVH